MRKEANVKWMGIVRPQRIVFKGMRSWVEYSSPIELARLLRGGEGPGKMVDQESYDRWDEYHAELPVRRGCMRKGV